MSQPNAETKDDLSSEDRAFLKDLAIWLAERRMSTPALLFLESVKPLNFVGSQVLFFFEPMVKALIHGKSYTRFAVIMENRENVEVFLESIEAADQEFRDRRKEEKK